MSRCVCAVIRVAMLVLFAAALLLCLLDFRSDGGSARPWLAVSFLQRAARSSSLPLLLAGTQFLQQYSSPAQLGSGLTSQVCVRLWRGQDSRPPCAVSAHVLDGSVQAVEQLLLLLIVCWERHCVYRS